MSTENVRVFALRTVRGHMLVRTLKWCILWVTCSIVYHKLVFPIRFPRINHMKKIRDAQSMAIQYLKKQNSTRMKLLIPCVSKSTILHDDEVENKSLQGYVEEVRPILWPWSIITSKTIYLTTEGLSQSTYYIAYTLVHECTHLILQSKDFAYDWQSHYMNLTKKEHKMNADSISQVVFGVFRKSKNKIRAPIYVFS